ncbi:MAG: hypothetical protein AAF682_18465 [Planctomycetota bacterium]
MSVRAELWIVGAALAAAGCIDIQERALAAVSEVPGGSKDRSELRRGDSAGYAMVVSGTLTKRIEWDVENPRELLLGAWEKNLAEDEWEEFNHRYSVPYDVAAVSHRTAEDVFVAGRIDRLGIDTVERWTFPAYPGAFQTSRPITSTPVGVASATASTSVGLTGGTYVPVAERKAPLVPDKEQLLASDLGGITSISADPDGRFVLLLTGAGGGTLWRLDLIDQATPIVLYTTQDIATLGESLTLSPRLHAVEGMKHVALGFVESLGPFYLHFNDPDNDGLFDSVTTFTADGYEAAGYLDPAAWSDDFITL